MLLILANWKTGLTASYRVGDTWRFKVEGLVEDRFAVWGFDDSF